jgi:hypothetical protein
MVIENLNNALGLFCEALAHYAIVQGMVAENMARERRGESAAWPEQSFFREADAISVIGNQLLLLN